MDGFEDVPEEIEQPADKRDLYANLGVSRDASDDEIKKAYRSLAQVAHPDKHSSSVLREAASKQFNVLNEAYEILSDSNRRKIYDVYGMSGLNAGLEIGRKHKSLAEITEEFQKAKAKEAREVMEAKLNFRGAYGFSFSAAHFFDENITYRRKLIAHKRGQPLPPKYQLDLNGVDFNSVFDVPTWRDNCVGYLGAQGQMSRGAGAGGLILGLRTTVSEHTSWEAAIVTGSQQSAATLHVQRQVTENTIGTLAYSFANAQGGSGLEVGVQRPLFDEYSKGHLTWNVGPVGGLTTGAQRAKNKTSWKFDVSVGPQSTGITGFIARRLSKKSTFRLGLRLGTNAIDFDAGVTRKMNRETQVGLSASVGIRGVHLKLRFNHSGQRFQFPILLSPRATVQNASLTLTLPFLAVFCVKRLVVNPYADKLLIEEQRITREKYSEQVSTDKAEARSAQTLLETQAASRLETEKKKKGLVVEAAVFGNFPKRGKHKVGDVIVEGFGDAEVGTSGDRNVDTSSTPSTSKPTVQTPWLDVTVATRFMVFDSHVDINAQTHKPSLLGFCDPCPDEKAYLRVRYRYRNVLHEVTVGEDEPLSIPNRKDELPKECQ